jgi:hypothetical protein
MNNYNNDIKDEYCVVNQAADKPNFNNRHWKACKTPNDAAQIKLWLSMSEAINFCFIIISTFNAGTFYYHIPVYDSWK